MHKLIIGLGNPGGQYENNRHNVGFMVVDALKSKGVGNINLRVFKTNTFMNDSGKVVKQLIGRHSDISASNVYIIHDDLDIKLGEHKVQFAKGPKVHNGLDSIYDEIGRDFWHVRIGVDNRDPERRVVGEKYVLEDFTKEEKIVIDKIIKEVCKKLATF